MTYYAYHLLGDRVRCNRCFKHQTTYNKRKIRFTQASLLLNQKNRLSKPVLPVVLVDRPDGFTSV